MTYIQNDDKPQALLANYTTVRGAELKEIYRLIERQGSIPVSGIEDRFARTPSGGGAANIDHVENCLKFLQTVDIMELSAQNVVSRLNGSVYPELSFEARLLHHIRQQDGEQYHLAYILDVMASLDSRRVTLQNLYEDVQEDDERAFGFQWTKEKLRMWANLTDTIGALSYSTAPEDNEIVTSPTRALLYELLQWYSEHGEEPDRFLAALDWVHDEIVPVYTSRSNVPEVSAGVADTLRNMEAEGVLSFRAMSDTQQVVRLPRHRGETEPVAEFTVEARPQTTPYEYPLDRSEREVIA